MSRKGKVPIPLPKDVEVKIHNGEVIVKGSKGTLSQKIPQELKLEISPKEIIVSIDESMDDAGAFHGLYHALITNMIIGTSQGFEKRLEMIGVGYRAAVKGKDLDVQVGRSHPTLMHIPEGVQVAVDKNTTIILTGIDKQKVGQFAADIRSQRPPEPYKGKGIRYVGEFVRKKDGKTSSK